MYLLTKFGDHRSYRNGDINSYINSYMDTLEKVELTASIGHIAIFLKSGIPIYNSEVPTGRKTRRRRRRKKCTQLQSVCASRKRNKQMYKTIDL